MRMTGGTYGLVATLLADVAFLFSATPAAAQSAVTIEKLTNGQDADSPPGPVVGVGSTVTWTYRVTSSGGRDLVNVVVTDDQGVMVSCPSSSVPAGTTMTCTASGTAVAGQYENLGMVDAELETGTPVSDADPSHYLGVAAGGVAIEKRTEGFDADTPPGPSLQVGSTVHWTYEVTNTSRESLLGIAVTDDQGVVITCPTSTLDAGGSMTCAGSGVVESGQYANVGSVLATTASGMPVGASDPSHYYGQMLLLQKRTEGVDADLPPGPVLLPGASVTWTYSVSNPGPETVVNLVVTDDQGVMVTCPQTTIAAGETVVCTATGVVEPGQYTNVGTATAELPSEAVVSASDPSHYYGREPGPAVSATKTVALVGDADGSFGVSPGDTLAYEITIVNGGTADAMLVAYVDVPDANTTLVVGSVMASLGTVTTGNGAGDTSVAVDVGTLVAGGGSATITYQVTVNDPLPFGVSDVANQGVVTGGNFEPVATDDPARPGPDDPTVAAVQAPSVLEVPTLGRWGVALLLLLLAGAGALRLSAR